MFNVNVASIKSELGGKAIYRAVEQKGEAYALREPTEVCNDDCGSKSEPLSIQHGVWNENSETAET